MNENQELSSYVLKQIEAWPEEVKVLAPLAGASIEDWTTFLDKGRALVDRLHMAEYGPPPGNSPGPRPSGLADAQAGVKALKERYRKSGQYSF